MSREVINHGKTVQVSILPFVNRHGQQRCSTHENHGRPTATQVQGLRAEVHAEIPA
jgi:hypothetical protein